MYWFLLSTSFVASGLSHSNHLAGMKQCNGLGQDSGRKKQVNLNSHLLSSRVQGTCCQTSLFESCFEPESMALQHLLLDSAAQGKIVLTSP